MNALLKLAMVAAIACAGTITAFAHEMKTGDLDLNHPWVRLPPKGSKVAGGFVKITNNGKEDDRLLSVSATISEKVELHTMTMDGGVMKMRPLADGIPLPAGEVTELKPGGLHVMFIGTKPPFFEGEIIETTFTFEKAGAVKVEMVFEAGRAMKKDEMKMKDGEAHKSH